MNNTHIGRYCGFLQGLNAIMNLYDINWSPEIAVNTFLEDYENNNPNRNINDFKNICYTNTTGGSGVTFDKNDYLNNLVGGNNDNNDNNNDNNDNNDNNNDLSKAFVNCYIDTSSIDFEKENVLTIIQIAMAQILFIILFI